MKICALRLSKNFVFPTICVLTSQNTDGEKFLCRNFSLSRSIKTEIHAPGFYDFALQSLFYARLTRDTDIREKQPYSTK